MHGLAITTLVLAGLAAHGVTHSVPPTPIRRKTLGFGPDLSHARFESIDVRALAAVDFTKDAYAVARDFLSQYSHLEAGRAYIIRPDSYTDDATGVTHIYARQIIDGIEVANGHVNLNIKDGRVLSFGDSFFPGEPDRSSQVPMHLRAHNCAQLSSVLEVQHPQLWSLASRDHTKIIFDLGSPEHFYVSNCVNLLVFSSIADSSEVDLDPRRPLLAFLASALPENHPEFITLEDKLEEHASNIIMTPEVHLLGEHASVGMSLSNVPGAVRDVKARIVWIQVPTEDGVKLELVHRFEVKMERNWYETTVTTSVPHRIISAIDWVSDSPMPMSVAVEDSATMLGLDRVLSEKKSIPPIPELSKASYFVFPWGTNDPAEAAQKKAAKRGEPPKAEYPLSYGREIVKEWDDTFASPAGWHTLPFSHDPSINKEDRTILRDSLWRTTRTTWGNNVFAQENWHGGDAWMYNRRPLADIDGVFSYPYAPEPAPTEDESLEQARAHINATVTQLFYTINMMHDLYYRYGFNEAAGNFQQYNFGRGGEEHDAIIADAQMGTGYDNAAFTTPPDGENGHCEMLLWDTNSPFPDGSMDAGIVVHEVSHGLSGRLTGGPKNSGCLGWGESGGMGEGWGDFISISVRSTSVYSDYPIAAWASNIEQGIRKYLYSTDKEVNPSTYETLDDPRYWGVHAIGEVWAEMLWVLQQRFIAKYGFSKTLFPPVPDADGKLSPNDFYRPQTFNPLTGSANPLVPKHGNTLLLQLVINGMKMQPCDPTFIKARDAIIEADKVLTGGENVCDIWEGFAERGLGVDAKLIGDPSWGGIRKNGFQVPARCHSGEPVAPLKPEPSFLWYMFKDCIGKWIPMLPWGY